MFFNHLANLVLNVHADLALSIYFKNTMDFPRLNPFWEYKLENFKNKKGMEKVIWRGIRQ